MEAMWRSSTLCLFFLSVSPGMYSSGGLLGQAGTPPNTLTEAERREGWRLLFDGTTTNGWRGYRSNTVPAGWQVLDGALTSWY